MKTAPILKFFFSIVSVYTLAGCNNQKCYSCTKTQDQSVCTFDLCENKVIRYGNCSSSVLTYSTGSTLTDRDSLAKIGFTCTLKQ
jgi:hypothetical protein